MQEIKFRVWDNKDKKFWLENNNLSIVNSMTNNLVNDDSTVIEQYTGIKDINGNDIYVGDVVHPVRIMKVLTETVVQQLSDKPIIVQGDTYVNSKWIARSVSATGFSVEDYYFGNELQLIGNIHENPELLVVK